VGGRLPAVAAQGARLSRTPLAHRHWRLAAFATALLLAFGCAGGGAKNAARKAMAEETPATVEAACRVKLDDYQGTALVSCPQRQGDLDLVSSHSYYRAHLRGMVNRAGAETFQLYVATRLDGGWQNFRGARDQHEIPLTVSKIDRKKNCEPGAKSQEDCTFYEHFGVSFTREYLEARTVRGIELRVRSQAGESEIVLPAAYVQGFMARLDATRGGGPASARAARSATRKSFCKAKYGSDEQAWQFCEQQARASYDRLSPALARMRDDSFTPESRALDQCMKRHGSTSGLDWMMVEHCFGRASARPPASTQGR
jgi:hypothetical protein